MKTSIFIARTEDAGGCPFAVAPMPENQDTKMGFVYHDKGRFFMPTWGKFGKIHRKLSKTSCEAVERLFHSSFFAFRSGNSSKNSQYFLMFFAEIRMSDYGEYRGFELQKYFEKTKSE